MKCGWPVPVSAQSRSRWCCGRARLYRDAEQGVLRGPVTLRIRLGAGGDKCGVPRGPVALRTGPGGDKWDVPLGWWHARA